jgi:uncharacterized protein (DUF1501 family)
MNMTTESDRPLGLGLSEGLGGARPMLNNRRKMMMGRSELCAWLRANSSGIYRPAAEAADEIEHLAAAKDQHFAQAMENGAKANAYREALEHVVRVMGPKAPPCCDGCETERTEALSTARDVLAPPNAVLTGPARRPQRGEPLP